MNNIDLVTRLGWMIEQAKKDDNQKLASTLGHLQLAVIEERSREWEKGFDAGHRLGVKEARLRNIK